MNMFGCVLCSVAVSNDVDGITAGHRAHYVASVSTVPLLSMFSTRAPQETTRSLRSLVHLFSRTYLVVEYNVDAQCDMYLLFRVHFLPREATSSAVFAKANCLSVRLSVCL